MMSPRAISSRAASSLSLAFPIGGGVKADRNAWLFAFETRPRPLDGARQMVVERDDDDANGGPDRLWCQACQRA